jgi:hypothetical protein
VIHLGRATISAMLVLGVLAGCSGPSRRPPSALSADHRVSGPESPRALRAYPFEYAELPVLSPVPIGGDKDGASFAFLPGKDGPELHMTGDLVAEIEVGVPPAQEELARNVAGHSRPYYHVFRQTDETGPFEWSAARGAGPICGRGAPPGRARWQGFVHRSRTPKGIAYRCFEGPFDPEKCAARADRAFGVTARPLVGDALFGFRAPDGVCSALTLAHEEKLVVVGPRPLWMASTAPLLFRAVDGHRSFARVAVPVARATSASAVVDTYLDDVSIPGGAPGVDRSGSTYSLSVEVVWASSAAAPTAVGFASVLTGDTSGLRPEDLERSAD